MIELLHIHTIFYITIWCKCISTTTNTTSTAWLQVIIQVIGQFAQEKTTGLGLPHSNLQVLKSKPNGGFPKSYIRFFHSKPSVLGYPIYGNSQGYDSLTYRFHWCLPEPDSWWSCTLRIAVVWPFWGRPATWVTWASPWKFLNFRWLNGAPQKMGKPWIDVPWSNRGYDVPEENGDVHQFMDFLSHCTDSHCDHGSEAEFDGDCTPSNSTRCARSLGRWTLDSVA